MGFMWRAITRRKYILSAFCGLAFLSLTVLDPPRKQYRSMAALHIQSFGYYEYLQPAFISGRMTTSPFARHDIAGEMEILQGRALAERVVDRIGTAAFFPRKSSGGHSPLIRAGMETLDKIPVWGRRESFQGGRSGSMASDRSAKNRENAIRSMMKHVHVRLDERENDITITFASSRPELPKRVLCCLLEEYFAERDAIRAFHDSHGSLSARTDSLLSNLAFLENEIAGRKEVTENDAAGNHRTHLRKDITSLRYRIDVNRLACSASHALISARESAVSRKEPESIAAKGFHPNGNISSVSRLHPELLSEYIRYTALLEDSLSLGQRFDLLSDSLRQVDTFQGDIAELEAERDIIRRRYDLLAQSLERARFNHIIYSKLWPLVTIRRPASNPARTFPADSRNTAWILLAAASMGVCFRLLVELPGRGKKKPFSRASFSDRPPTPFTTVANGCSDPGHEIHIAVASVPSAAPRAHFKRP